MAGGGAGPAPPPRPAGLRREAFAESVPVLALRVPARHTQAVQRALRQSRLLLDRPRTKSVRDCAASRQHRLLLLDERLQTRPPDAPLDAADPAHHLLPAPLAAFLSDLPEAVRRFQPRPKKPKEDPPPPPAAGEEEGGGPPPRPQPEVEVEVEVVREALELGYEDYAYEQVLRRVLPEGVDVPTSFETVGHIAHLNLRDEHLPFKCLIGEVLLDKNRPRLRSVVNKVGVLESSNTFRTLPLEVIAGDADLETEVRQYGARFRLNYAEVYWNSRLEAEHRRLVEEFQPGEAVCDMMAGIGPFAVPAAMRGHRVYANDLNPRCKHYLDVNAQRNKLRAPILSFCMCGRDFLRGLLAGRLDCEGEGADVPGAGAVVDHVVMNLPATALEFLDAFWGAFVPNRAAWANRELPLVHCYCFAPPAEASREAALARAAEYLGLPNGGAALHEQAEARVHAVRDVAPNKHMLCVTFRVPAEIAFAEGRHPRRSSEPSNSNKRAKTDAG